MVSRLAKLFLILLFMLLFFQEDVNIIYGEENMERIKSMEELVEIAQTHTGIKKVINIEAFTQSLPIPLYLKGQFLVGFIFFRKFGLSPSPPKVYPPRYRVLVESETGEIVEIVLVKPGDFQINLPPDNPLGEHKLSPDITMKIYLEKRKKLYQLYDEILPLYKMQKSPFLETEREEIEEFYSLFNELVEKPLLPFYKALNPEFFLWLEGKSVGPSASESEKILVYFDSASEAEKKGNFKLAYEVYLAAIESIGDSYISIDEPIEDDTELKLKAAEIQYQRGNFQKAVSVIKDVLETRRNLLTKRFQKIETVKSELQKGKGALIISIEEIVRYFLSPEATIEMLIKRLGSVVEKQRESGYRLKPFDRAFKEIWIAIKESGAKEELQYIEFTLSEPPQLTIAEVNAVFGEGKELPIIHYDDPMVISYIYNKPELPFEGAMFLSLSGEPSVSDTRILSVKIRRDERSNIKTFHLGQEFILNYEETAKLDESSLTVTNKNISKLIIDADTFDELYMVKLALSLGMIKEEIELSLSSTGHHKDKSSIFWQGYLITVIQADSYHGSPVTLRVTQEIPPNM